MKFSAISAPSLAASLQRHILPLLMACYLLAAFCPGPGLFLHGISIGSIGLGGSRVAVSPTMLLLGVLLFTSSISIPDVRVIFSSRRLLLAGVAANVFLPALFLAVTSLMMVHTGGGSLMPDLIVGLALLSASPVAGASTAYTQNADGDLSLGVGLVLASSFLSPILMPLSLGMVDFMAAGDHTASMKALLGGGSMLSLVLGVMIPSLFGLLLRPLIGGKRVDAAKPWIKCANTGVILMLNYSNASTMLPDLLVSPDARLLSWAFALMVGMCLSDFMAGWWIGSVLGGGRAGSLALMFGVGMDNNVAALLLGAPVFPGRTTFLLPLVFYGLVQQTIAATLLSLMARRQRSEMT